MDSYTSSTHPRKPSARQHRPEAFPPLPATLCVFPLPFPSVSFYACTPLPLSFLMRSSLLSPALVPPLSPLLWLHSPLIWPIFSYDPPSSQTIAGGLFSTQISLIPAALPLCSCSSNRSSINNLNFVVSSGTACLCSIPPSDLQCLYPNKFSAKVTFLKLISIRMYIVKGSIVVLSWPFCLLLYFSPI